MVERYGAPPEAWEKWLAIGAGDDLLPTVANPNAEIAPESKLSAAGKVPCRYNAQRKVVGVGKWTSYLPSPNEIRQWQKEPDYGICVQTRGSIKAFDVDVADPAKSKAIKVAITTALGPCPVRYRENSGKLLIPIRCDALLPKRVLQVDGGMVEFLGVGQQFQAEGLHPSGEAYKWNGTALPEMALPDADKLQSLFDTLEMCFGTSEWKISREKRDGGSIEKSSGGTDPVAGWLLDNWTVHGSGASGELFIECPFAVSHTSDSGPTSTAYFPAGTGGYSQGHFVCLHAHCTGRSDSDFLDATGYSKAEFGDLFQAPATVDDRGKARVDDAGEPVQTLANLNLVRDGKGRIEASADNLVKICAEPSWIGRRLAYDQFRDELIWAPREQPLDKAQWRTFTDCDYVDVLIELERRGVKPMSQDMLRRTVLRASYELNIDTAQEWLGRLQWDGIARLESFCIAGWGWQATDYSRAVGRYIWTALAGRVIEPGVQCDMAPILVGPQGEGKTSAIKAMAPAEEHYVSIPLDERDADTSRRLRGKLVGELEELRGLNSRAIEEIKAWITRTTEGWIPKYREFENQFKRRIIFFGSTNDDEFLNDPTGERRWLPGRCGKLDVEWIKANRDQLWAEGAVRFRLDGVDWSDAQRLGMSEHLEFKVTDAWEGAVERWLTERPIGNAPAPVEVGHVMISDVLAGAVGIMVTHQDRGKEMRMAKVLRHLGWKRARLNPQPDGSRPWAYVKDDG